jgi:pimeloyl-ACP methyl ester carboxylesterase
MKKLIHTIALSLIMIACFSQQPAIQVTKTGKGDPVIFLPGFITPGSVWNETIRHLAVDHENHIVSYAGFNGLAPIEMPWYETIKQALIAYIVKEKLSGFSIIGHSMGGNLATEIAAEMPTLCKRIILADALPCIRELWMPGVAASKLQYNSSYNKELLAMPAEAFKENAVMMAKSMTNKTEKTDSLVKWITEADRKTYVYGYTDLLKLDLRDKLSKITAKALILGAPFPDKNSVTANFEKQYLNLSAKTIEIAPDSKHFIMFDQPEWFYEKLNAFLTK